MTKRQKKYRRGVSLLNLTIYAVLTVLMSYGVYSVTAKAPTVAYKNNLINDMQLMQDYFNLYLADNLQKSENFNLTTLCKKNILSDRIKQDLVDTSLSKAGCDTVAYYAPSWANQKLLLRLGFSNDSNQGIVEITNNDLISKEDFAHTVIDFATKKFKKYNVKKDYVFTETSNNQAPIFNTSTEIDNQLYYPMY